MTDNAESTAAICPGCGKPTETETVKYYDGQLVVSTCCGWEVEDTDR